MSSSSRFCWKCTAGQQWGFHPLAALFTVGLLQKIANVLHEVSRHHPCPQSGALHARCSSVSSLHCQSAYCQLWVCKRQQMHFCYSNCCTHIVLRKVTAQRDCAAKPLRGICILHWPAICFSACRAFRAVCRSSSAGHLSSPGGFLTQRNSRVLAAAAAVQSAASFVSS